LLPVLVGVVYDETVVGENLFRKEIVAAFHLDVIDRDFSTA
jgi:hypothetical protein